MSRSPSHGGQTCRYVLDAGRLEPPFWRDVMSATRRSSSTIRPATSAGSTTILEMRAVDPFDGPASGLGGGCLFGEDRADLKISTPR
jgi:hypothetical protein